ncbi:MAG: hypothetical protein Q7S79_01125 [bacterium]|nr:hypothetical protein [bacterium]
MTVAMKPSYKRVKCSSCGEEYRGIIFYEDGKFPKVPTNTDSNCPKCDCKNELEESMPDWDNNTEETPQDE